jgi:hypothetical protein
MTAAALAALLNEIVTLEPAAFALITKLVSGLQGKSDAEVLAADNTTLTALITAAQAGK